MADLTQLARFARLFAVLPPGLDVKPLLAELRARVVEELDYELEADAQRGFAAAYADDPEMLVPRVVASAPAGAGHRVDRRARRCRRIIATGDAGAARPRRLRCWRCCTSRRRSGPACCTPTRTRATSGCCRTGGSASSTSARWPGCPTGCPSRSAGCCGWRWRARPTRCWPACGARASSSRTCEVDAERGAGLPAADAGAAGPGRRSASPGPGCAGRRPGSPTRATRPAQLGRQLNLPPSYLLIHRVTLGSIGVLCQLDAEAPYRVIVERWLPGFAK